MRSTSCSPAKDFLWYISITQHNLCSVTRGNLQTFSYSMLARSFRRISKSRICQLFRHSGKYLAVLLYFTQHSPIWSGKGGNLVLTLIQFQMFIFIVSVRWMQQHENVFVSPRFSLSGNYCQFWNLIWGLFAKGA